jgi:hypothetical protein
MKTEDDEEDKEDEEEREEEETMHRTVQSQANGQR